MQALFLVKNITHIESVITTLRKMDDLEAEKQTNHMINFILDEAKQTAATIQLKADEDFNVEKLKLVQNMKEKTLLDTQKTLKKLETKKAIERSTSINKARLAKIGARQQCIERMQGEVALKLAEASKSDVKYKQIIIDLIVQGALKLMEDEVTLQVRPQDVNLVRSLLDQATQAYVRTVQAQTGSKKSIKLLIDSSTLPSNSLGGVVVTCMNGMITVDNTLDTRLKLVMENDRPALRAMLFPAK